MILRDFDGYRKSVMCCGCKNIPYSTLSSPPKRLTFPKFVRGLDNGDFLFFKIFKFLKSFLLKENGGLFYYYGIVFK